VSRLAAPGLALLLLASIGCARNTTTYYWSGYQWSAYSGNQIDRGGPESKRFEATLKRILERSDAAKRKPPPGVAAEYGYLFFRRGEMDAAVQYFEREAREWPESGAFMRWMVQQVRGRSGS
jgi:hypothetical protein